eukprot:jgi/Tetstr1/420873/TSEL_001075.t1
MCRTIRRPTAGLQAGGTRALRACRAATCIRGRLHVRASARSDAQPHRGADVPWAGEEGRPKVLLAAGGTGGHVYPAIAVAEVLLSRRVRVAFAGTRERMEWGAATAAGFPIHALPAVALRRPLLSWVNLLLPFRLAVALLQALRLLTRLRPAVVVGTGGYVAFPTCLAAWLTRTPFLLQEQNAVPGLANRCLARLASLVCVAFPGCIAHLPSSARCVVTGNPVRPSLCGADPAAARRALGLPADGAVVALVGGSLGAAALNGAMIEAAPKLLARGDVSILWATGPALFQQTIAQVEPDRRLRVLPYLDDMGAVYAAADLVVGRAGAMTCSELAATGCAAILVPLPSAAGDHQTANARHMADQGASILLPQAELSGISLAASIDRLLGDTAALLAMRKAAAAMAPAEPPAECVANHALTLAGLQT